MHSSFDYHRAGSLKDACRFMAELPGAQILAGGTDLLLDIGSGIRRAANVVSVGDVPELKEIQLQGDRMCIGAGCTAAAVERSALIGRHFPELAEMVVRFASPQIRARATLGGNICSAVACGDFPPILMALGSEIELCQSNGSRVLPLKDFFTGNRQTVRRDQEVLTRILIPLKSGQAAANYQKYRRRASNSLAVASVAAFLEMDGLRCRAARIVLGAVAPTPWPAEGAAMSLVGKAVDDSSIATAGRIAREEARPITDQRASADFRRELIQVLAARALREALRGAQDGLRGKQEGHE
jgi:CO/xanthine dehydrogenase FAD-binding subunit